eukprot:gene16235-22401_t
MESHDRRFVLREIPRFVSEGEAPVEEEGILASVMMKDGRLVGTLGHEEELRRMRRALIPKKTIATLEAGNRFGGGAKVMGEGDLQQSLKVRALRDDESFKLTYYMGRVGTISSETIVGHKDSKLAAAQQSAIAHLEILSVPTTMNPMGGWMSRSNTISPGNPAKQGSGKKKRDNAKQTHESGQHSVEVQKALAYITSLKTQFEDQALLDEKAGMSSGGYLIIRSCTPSERFWSTPALSGTAAGNAIRPLISSVYPEGLGPLAEKIDDLTDRSVRHTLASVAKGPSPAPTTTALQERLERLHQLSQPVSPSSTAFNQFSTRMHASHCGRGSATGEATSSNSHPSAHSRSKSAMDFHTSPKQSTLQGLHSSPQLADVSSSLAPGREPSKSRPSTAPRSKGVRTIEEEEEEEEDFDFPLVVVEESDSFNPCPDPHASWRHGPTSPHSESMSASLSPGPGGGSFSPGPGGGFPGPREWGGPPVNSRKNRPGSVAAAGIIWERSDEAYCGTPALRQCLMYEEIARLKRPSTSSSIMSSRR